MPRSDATLERLATLKAQYLDRLPARVDSVVALGFEALAGDAAKWAQVRDECHKIAGTAASFGAERIGRICFDMLELLPAGTEGDVPVSTDIEQRLNELRQAIQSPDLDARFDA